MSTEATRMQDLASEYSKIFQVDTPGPPQREEATPSRTHSQPDLWRGAQAPQCWDPNLGPPQLFSRSCAPRLQLGLSSLIALISDTKRHLRDCVIKHHVLTASKLHLCH